MICCPAIYLFFMKINYIYTVTELAYYGKLFFTLGELQIDCWRCKKLYFSTLSQLATVLVLYLLRIIFKNLLGLQKTPSSFLSPFFSTICNRHPLLHRETNTGKSAYLVKFISTPKSILPVLSQWFRNMWRAEENMLLKLVFPAGQDNTPLSCFSSHTI